MSQERRRGEFSIKRVFITVAVIVTAGALVYVTRPQPIVKVIGKLEGKKTLEDRLSQYGDVARERVTPVFKKKGLAYPPKRLVFVGLKKNRVLQLYADSGDGKCHFVRSYPIIAASGHLGPKLHEGDCQVPEGIYRVTFLNPNSLYHLSLRLNYPNEFDLMMAEKEGRTKPGSDIMIHGSDCSVGCLAMGDPASEELFVMAADIGIENIKVILSPVDFRKVKMQTEGLDLPAWAGELYKTISDELAELPVPAAD